MTLAQDRVRVRVPATEAYLVQRVLDALLREGYLGAGVLVSLPEVDDEQWLDVGARYLPVRPGRFLADWVLRRPAVAVRVSGELRLVEGLDDVLALFTPPDDADVDPDERTGYAAFVDECREAREALDLGERHRTATFDRLVDRHGTAPTGVAGSVYYDALAAHVDHPVYPTARCRHGIAGGALRRHAPEFAPEFALRWAGVPADLAVRHGQLPPWWPTSTQLGLPDGFLPFPVHPLTWHAVELPGGLPSAVPLLRVAPTLSMRTVAPLDHPDVHIKVPLPTSTLGARNRRSIKPGTLTDGAVVQQLLADVLREEPALRARVLLADESTYGHAGHEYLGYLVRRSPAGLDDSRVVTAAALLAETPSGRLVIAELADEFFAGDVLALFEAYLRLLFELHVTLWLRYGIALESHQQNTSLVLTHGRPIRLLYKDNDGARIDPTRLGRVPPVDDQRMLVRDPYELSDLFTAITVHLCAGAPAFGLAERGVAPVDQLLGLVRRCLVEAAAAHDATVLRDRVLDARRLPAKSMVIAGTLRSKARTGATDINKYYGTTSPNYLLPRRT
ncbi:MAG TPA: IucA/IucC family protein [Jatrophihabitantaceae bacterium]